MERLRASVTNLEGPTAPPRKNGELVFGAPWESRAFGMAVALQGEGAYSWEEFSALLAAEIASEGRSSAEPVLPVAPEAEATYYERWLSSLEKLLIAKSVVSRDELEARAAEFAAGEWDHP